MFYNDCINFSLDSTPPSQTLIDGERTHLQETIRALTLRDTLMTFILVILMSGGAGVVAYWISNDFLYAEIASAVFPVLAVILSLAGVMQSIGFRSIAHRLDELRNQLAALSPVNPDTMSDVEKLMRRHRSIAAYQEQLVSLGRPPVNGELAVFWEFDSSTQARTARGRDFLEQARESVNA